MRLVDVIKLVDEDKFRIYELSFGDGSDCTKQNIPQTWENAKIERIYVEDGKLTFDITED